MLSELCNANIHKNSMNISSICNRFYIKYHTILCLCSVDWTLKHKQTTKLMPIWWDFNPLKSLYINLKAKTCFLPLQPLYIPVQYRLQISNLMLVLPQQTGYSEEDSSSQWNEMRTALFTLIDNIENRFDTCSTLIFIKVKCICYLLRVCL